MDTLLVYGRVSDKGKQGDNFSIPSQLSLMRKWGEAEHYDIIELADTDSAYIDGLERPKLQEALAMAEAGKISAFMYFSSDRFTRDTGDGVVLRKTFKLCGVKLFCFHPTPHEIMVSDTDKQVVYVLQDWQAQKESERRRDSSMRGINQKIEEKVYPQGWAPYGYRVVGRKHQSHLEIHASEARIVRLIFVWYYFSNMGVQAIADRLNEMGVPSNAFNRGSTLWSGRRVLLILANEAYKGTWYANTWKRVNKRSMHKRPKEERVEIAVPQIIYPYLFHEVREKMNTRHTGREKTGEYLMSCRITCTCGRHMSGKCKHNGVTNKTYRYYHCNSVRDKRFCKQKAVAVELVDAIVWQFASELLNDPEKLIRGYQAMHEEGQAEGDIITGQITTLTEQITEQQAALSDIIDQRATTKWQAVKDALDQKIEEYGAAIDRLATRVFELKDKREKTRIDEDFISESIGEIEALRRMGAALAVIDEEEDFAAKRSLIELLNLKATIRDEEDGSRWIDIHWIRNTYPKKLCTQSSSAARR